MMNEMIINIFNVDFTKVVFFIMIIIKSKLKVNFILRKLSQSFYNNSLSNTICYLL